MTSYQNTDIAMDSGGDLYSAKRVRFTPVVGKYIGIWFGTTRTSDQVRSVRSSLPNSTDTRFTVAPTSQALYVRNSPSSSGGGVITDTTAPTLTEVTLLLHRQMTLHQVMFLVQMRLELLQVVYHLVVQHQQ